MGSDNGWLVWTKNLQSTGDHGDFGGEQAREIAVGIGVDSGALNVD